MFIVSIGGLGSLPLENYASHRSQGHLQLCCCGGVRCRVLESTEEQPPAVVLAGGLKKASGELGPEEAEGAARSQGSENWWSVWRSFIVWCGQSIECGRVLRDAGWG